MVSTFIHATSNTQYKCTLDALVHQVDLSQDQNQDIKSRQSCNQQTKDAEIFKQQQASIQFCQKSLEKMPPSDPW
jgi:hypothetical protein